MRRRWFGRFWRTWSQNLTSDGDNEHPGPLWRHGRGSVTISRDEDGPGMVVEGYWHVGPARTCDMILGVGGESLREDAGVRLSILGATLVVAVVRVLPARIRAMPYRWIGWNARPDGINLFLWADPAETSERAPFWDARSPWRTLKIPFPRWGTHGR